MAIQSSRRGKRLVLTIALPCILVAFFGLGGCSGEKTKDRYPISQYPGGPADPALVKKLYEVKCAICHGFDGRQQYAGAKNLGLSTMTRVDVVNQIHDGKGAMPPQKDVLSKEQIEALADFIMTFRNQ